MMIRFRMKNCNIILTDKLQKYHPYHQVKLISMNILHENKYDHLIKNK